MANYELTEAADEDLKGIAVCTISKWGPTQAVRYGAFLDAHFEAIGAGKARSRIFLRHRPELRVVTRQASLRVSFRTGKPLSVGSGRIP